MRLVFIYGPPGVGKLTVATHLAEITGFRLLHNHLTVNLVTAVFPVQSEPWERMSLLIRREMFAEAAREGIDVIFTGAYRATGRIEPIAQMVEPVRAQGGSVLFVQLVCEEAELLTRVKNESRKIHGKLTDADRLRERLTGKEMDKSLPFQPHLRLDNARLAADQAAARIAEYFSLPMLTV